MEADSDSSDSMSDSSAADSSSADSVSSDDGDCEVSSDDGTCGSTCSGPSSIKSDLSSADGLSDDGHSDDSSSVQPTGNWHEVLCKLGRRLHMSKLRVILPCAGWDAPSQALQHLGVDHEVVGAWDVDSACHDVLRQVHHIKPGKRMPKSFHIGKTGDIQRVRVKSLPDADILCSGPPCPPFSAIGRRKMFKDPRSNILNVVLAWIFHLAQMSLKCFVLENVMGILSRPKSGGKSPVEVIMAKLSSHLPSCWRIEYLTTWSKCTAQNRKRVFIIGYIPVRGAPQCPLQKALPRLPPQDLSFIIKSGVKNTPLCDLSKRKRANLNKYKDLLSTKLHSREFSGQFAAIEIDRNPERKWGKAFRTDGLCMTLRASHSNIFIVSLGEGEPRIQRFLLPEEAAALQGMSADIIPSGMSRRRVFRGLGNSITVPVMGVVLSATLERAMGRKTSSSLAAVRSASSSSSTGDESSGSDSS